MEHTPELQAARVELERQGFLTYTVDNMLNAHEIVNSGQYDLPFSQEEAEAAFVQPNGFEIVDLFLNYPGFLEEALAFRGLPPKE